MPELQKHPFGSYVGIDIASPPERVPPGKLRRANGVDLSREKGAIAIRRGQSRLNTTAMTIWDVGEGYTTSGDEKQITLPSWRFTLAATDTNKTFCTQEWEVEQVQGDTVAASGTLRGIWAFEESDHGATNIPDSSDVFSLFKSQNRRYQKVGASLYKDFDEWFTNFSKARSQFVAFRPLNDTTIWTFMADDTQPVRTDGTSVFNWSIQPPDTAPTIAAGSSTGLTGDYSVRYTYARLTGTTVLVESNPSPAPAAAVTLSNQDLSITALVASGDPQVTHIRIYRTVANGGLFLFDQSISNDVVTATSSQADTALGAQVETDNGAVPKADLCTLHNEHILFDGDATNPGYLWIGKRFKPWSVPATNFLEMNADDPGRAIVSWGGFAIRFTRDTKYRMVGTDITNFRMIEAHSKRGILPGKPWAVTQDGVWYMANDGVYLTDGIIDREVSADIKPIFEGRTVDNNPPVNKAGNHDLEFFGNKLKCFYSANAATEPSHLATFDMETQGWTIEEIAARSAYFERDINIITRGGGDGFVYEMEDEDATGDAGSNITVDVLTAEAAPNGTSTFRRYVKANADVHTRDENVTLSLFLDGTSVDSITLSNASRRLFREHFDGGQIGQRGALRFEYAGTADVRVGAVDLLFDQLEDA